MLLLLLFCCCCSGDVVGGYDDYGGDNDGDRHGDVVISERLSRCENVH